MSDGQRTGTVDERECAEFQRTLPALLDEDNPNLADNPHIQTCEKCAALVRDLEAIAQAARELLPTYDPSPNLWNQIQSAMVTGGLEENPDDHLGTVVADGPEDGTGPTPRHDSGSFAVDGVKIRMH
jgi:hypothetical protein